MQMTIQTDKKPQLLLHCCCAPCASYVLEYLSPKFAITIYYYNPNIKPYEEYEHRLAEMRKLIVLRAPLDTLEIIIPEYEPGRFDEIATPYITEPEGGARCKECFALRLGATSKYAKEQGFEYFTTTLSVSPHKNAKQLSEVGNALAQECGIKYLDADFKKHDGYKRSIELSKQYGLYRQQYCGCLPRKE